MPYTLIPNTDRRDSNAAVTQQLNDAFSNPPSHWPAIDR